MGSSKGLFKGRFQRGYYHGGATRIIAPLPGSDLNTAPRRELRGALVQGHVSDVEGAERDATSPFTLLSAGAG